MTGHRGRHGAVYTEGAMAELILRDAKGRTVQVQRKQPEGLVKFTDLDLGTYVLEPALRPCDANCGSLDPRIDGCAKTLDVQGLVNVKVDFTVGSHCRVRAS